MRRSYCTGSLKEFVTVVLCGAVLLSCSPLQAPQGTPVFKDHSLPASLSLCEEHMPLENPAVQEMLDRELTISIWNHAQVFLWLKRAGRYFPYIEKKLSEAGMPSDLKYLPVAESSLLTYAESNKGAVGLWQIIEETGQRNGLRNDVMVDERQNFERETAAALNYLKNLKDMFGSWTLALAAYNCGEARLKKEMDLQKVNDYYRLNLPRETERFIFRIAAIKLIIEHPEQYGYTIPQDHVYKPVACDTVEITIDKPLHITDVARALGTDYKVLKELNPELLDHYVPSGTFLLHVPAGLGSRVPAVIQQLLLAVSTSRETASDYYYTIQQGDTIERIAQKTGVSADMLKLFNKLSDAKLKPGQTLKTKP